jgi:hypothetical protein
MPSRRERPANWGPRPPGGQSDDAYDDFDDGEPEQRLGDWLRLARLGKGLTFTEVERVTRINRHYLEALEAEHYDVLPAPVYARGFLRSYARMLGLDPETAIGMMPTDLPRPPGLDPLPGLRRATHDNPAIPFPSLPSIPLATRGWVIAAAGVVLLVALVWIVPAMTGDDASPATTASGPVAGRVLESIGVTFVAVDVPSDAPAGTVVGQTPQPGANIETGDNVTLVVSRGPLR